MIDDEQKAANSKRRLERAARRAHEHAAARERAKVAVPHVGLAVYFHTPVTTEAASVERIAKLLVDARWPWLPWWVRSTGKRKEFDRTAVRVGGKNGVGPLLTTINSGKTTFLRLDRSMGEGNLASVSLDVESHGAASGYPRELLVTCRTVDLPKGKTFEAWLSLAHDLVTAIGATHATLGAWPSFNMAIQDTWRTRMILDTPKGDFDLGLTEDFREQIDALGTHLRLVGKTYARHPRWGTYLHAGHVAAIGGVERIRAEVGPARIDPVGELTYIQLTDSIETALTPEAGAKRRALEALMAPILLGAPVPPLTPSP